MCMKPDIPKPPKPAKQPQDVGASADTDQRRRAMGFARTIMTGAKGLTGAAPTAGKMLLGA